MATIFEQIKALQSEIAEQKSNNIFKINALCRTYINEEWTGKVDRENASFTIRYVDDQFIVAITAPKHEVITCSDDPREPELFAEVRIPLSVFVKMSKKFDDAISVED